MIDTLTPRVWHCRDPRCPRDTVYVGRPSMWGNPFLLGALDPETQIPMTREKVINKYAAMIAASDKLQRTLSFLKGKHLSCWCKPFRTASGELLRPDVACHADVLFGLANKGA